MPINLHIIASCTERKRGHVPRELHLGMVHDLDLNVRAHRWWSALQTHPHPPCPARDLYAGDHWRVILELPALAAQAHLRPQLWVASAGYGLVHIDAALRPYSATFARRHTDSVASGVLTRSAAFAHQEWWHALSRQPGPAPAAPRSIQLLAESTPHARILVVASPTYVEAMKEDLLLAARTLNRPEHLLIVSTPSPLSKGKLAPHWIPSNAHLQVQLGGARQSLHARVARHILQHGRRLDALELQRYYAQLIQRSAPPERYNRTPMTDDEVRQFIVRAQRTETLSYTAALRRLRGSGLACEQQRFKRLFTETRERT